MERTKLEQFCSDHGHARPLEQDDKP